MTRVLTAALLVALMGAWTVAQAGDALPWNKEKPAEPAEGEGEKETPEKKADAKPAKPAMDLEKALGERMYRAKIMPVKTLEDRAKAALANVKKEEEKKTPNAARIRSYHLAAARQFLAASAKAKSAAGSVPRNVADREAVAEAILAQYAKPLQAKAVAIYVQLGDEAFEAKDLRNSIAFYKEAQKIDADSEEAKAGLKKIEELVNAARQRAAGGPDSGREGGGSDDDDLTEERFTGRKDHTKTGREFKDDYKKRW
jgi:hypothetical protein